MILFWQLVYAHYLIFMMQLNKLKFSGKKKKKKHLTAEVFQPLSAAHCSHSLPASRICVYICDGRTKKDKQLIIMKSCWPHIFLPSYVL